MAKCVRMVGQGVPYRMHDEDAADIVRSGDGEYCPKSVFKAHWANEDHAQYLADNPKIVVNLAAAQSKRYDPAPQGGG